MTYDIVAGWTAPIDIVLLTQGISPSGTMVGLTPSLILRDLNGNTLDTAGDMTVPDTSAWTVRYTPDANDLVPGTYRMRVKIQDSGGGIAYFPSAEWDTLVVRSE